MVLELSAGGWSKDNPLTISGSDRRTLASSYGNERKRRQVAFPGSLIEGK